MGNEDGGGAMDGNRLRLGRKGRGTEGGGRRRE